MKPGISPPQDPGPPPAALVPAATESAYSAGDLDEAIARERERILIEMRSSDEAQLRSALSNIESRLSDARQGVIAYADTAAEETCGLILQALRTMLPNVSERLAAAEIGELLEGLRETFRFHPSATVRMNGATVATLEETLRRTGSGIPDSMTIIADQVLAPGDVVVSWSGGCVSRDTNHLMEQIDALFSRIEEKHDGR